MIEQEGSDVSKLKEKREQKVEGVAEKGEDMRVEQLVERVEISDVTEIDVTGNNNDGYEYAGLSRADEKVGEEVEGIEESDGDAGGVEVCDSRDVCLADEMIGMKGEIVGNSNQVIENVDVDANEAAIKDDCPDHHPHYDHHPHHDLNL